MGSIDAWFYKTLAGIRPAVGSPAFKTFIIDPYYPKNLGWASASTDTLRGKITSQWYRSDEHLSMSLVVPFNTEALVYVACDRNCVIEIDERAVEDAPGVQFLRYENGKHILKVSAGRYDLKADLS